MRIIISNIIKEQRQRIGVNQETLASKFGVSVQAVSKWENGASCPDITLLPEIADYFGVTVDYLLTGRAPNTEIDNGIVKVNDELKSACPDANTLYIAEIYNGHIVSADKAFSDNINLTIPESLDNRVWNISVSAPVSFGDIRGNIYVCENGNAAFNGKISGPVNVKDSSGDISFNGSISGDVTITNTATAYISGDISESIYITGGNAALNGSLNVGCDFTGEITGKNCKINIEGDSTGGVSGEGNYVNVEGDFTGNVATESGNIAVEGDFTGNVATESGNIAVEGGFTCEGAATISGNFNVNGDVNGNISTESGDISVGGDVYGNISSYGSGNINIEGDALNTDEKEND